MFNKASNFFAESDEAGAPAYIFNSSTTSPRSGSRSGSPAPSKSLRETFNEKMPQSMKAEVLVKVKEENPEVQKERAELVRTTSPARLAQITSISDFPVPSFGRKGDKR